MSYCRWSTDDFGCDIYAYQSQDGYVIHVAGRRPKGEVPKVDWAAFSKADLDDGAASELLVSQQTKQAAYLASCEWEDLSLGRDGETIKIESIDDFKSALLELRGLGYRFPDTVLDEIETELETV